MYYFYEYEPKDNTTSRHYGIVRASSKAIAEMQLKRRYKSVPTTLLPLAKWFAAENTNNVVQLW